MRKFGSAFDPAIEVDTKVTLKGVTITVAKLPANHHINHYFDEHTLGVSPDYATITPASSESDKIRDVQWRPGSIGFLPAGVRIKAEFPEAVVGTYIGLPDHLFRSAAFETIDVSKLEYRWRPDTIDPVATGLISAMVNLSKMVDASDWPVLAESIGTALAVRMAQQLGAEPRRNEPYPAGLTPECLRLVLDYIEANLSRQIRLPELAGVACLSAFHFARAFKQATNVAPIRYVWRRRIERAKESLKNAKTPLAVIAYACGFSSQSHFTTAFRQMTGETPAAWRAGRQ